MYMCVHVSLLSLSLFACLLRRWACGDGGARPSPPARKRYASSQDQGFPQMSRSLSLCVPYCRFLTKHRRCRARRRKGATGRSNKEALQDVPIQSGTPVCVPAWPARMLYPRRLLFSNAATSEGSVRRNESFRPDDKGRLKHRLLALSRYHDHGAESAHECMSVWVCVCTSLDHEIRGSQPIFWQL